MKVINKLPSQGVIANEVKQSRQIATASRQSGTPRNDNFDKPFTTIYAQSQSSLPVSCIESLEDKLELLFSDGFSPLLAFVFLTEFESKFLIKMACWMETCEGPKIDPLKLLLPAKFDGLP